MPRFPEFFQEHAVLPPGVSDPTDRTPWEQALLAKLHAGGGATAPAWIVQEGHLDDYLAISDTGADTGDRDEDLLDVTNEAVDLLTPEALQEGPSGGYGGADTIAHYWPWHLHGSDWGIYFDGPGFWVHVWQIHAQAAASGVSLPPATVAEDVFRQILTHEQTHFAGEILGTELEQAIGRSGYRDYVLTRYGFRNPWTTGFPEEILATHREVNAAAIGPLKRAAKELATDAPPGYSDWRLAADERVRRLIETTVARQMMPEAGTQLIWPTPGKRESSAVPLYWRQGGVHLPPFLRRAVGRITPRSVRKYLEHHDFELVKKHTAGHHYWYERDGLTAAFSVQRGEIPHKEHSPLAKSLGFTNPAGLRRALAELSPPPALVTV